MGEPEEGGGGGGGGLRRGSLALLTDLYQFTMAYGYWRGGRHREPAHFELFFRRCPFQGAFAHCAGLGECLAFLRAFRFSPADIEYLESVLPVTTDKAFFDYLLTVDASEVSVSSVPEGSVVFSKVPLFQVKGPLLVVQLLETTLLCLVNYASLVATNAARFRLAAGPHKKLMEMGLRRAQGPDGGLSASRYSYMGGFDFTSNVLAGKLYGIPLRGTVAHSYVSSFTSLAEVNPREWHPKLLCRSPCPERAGIPSHRSPSGQWGPGQAVGGDQVLVPDLQQAGNEIDMIGVGTHLVTCPLQPSLGCVYKLVEVNGCPRLKVTEDKEKATIPGSKVVYRLWDAAGFPCMDLLALEEESPPRAGQEVEFWPLGGAEGAGKVTPAAVEILHRVYLKNGQVCQPLPSLLEIRNHALASLSKLNPAHKRLQEPEAYQVAMTEKLHILLTALQRDSQ
ncbi:nicotinate phosphoribosyltransferase isoform X4 [Hemicordylus capensis]|uniref:nicotinate phosphoribosyltransferase isoform X4 n=1 Tax=Hemicordylus capensis TaxID=884348 RepID=UPI00230498C8|nr:nicotinate phosphoribosyltransferase isoform X4 [Hemicordylus capensis]